MTETATGPTDQVQSERDGPITVASPSVSTQSSADTRSGIVIPTYSPVLDDGGRVISASARLNATLAQEGSCLVAVAEGQRFVLVFPEGSARFTESGVLEYKGQAYRVGDRLDVAGGFMSSDEAPTVRGLPSNCPANSFWKVG